MKIKVLVIEPVKVPVVKEIDSSLESMQAVVGGYIRFSSIAQVFVVTKFSLNNRISYKQIVRAPLK